MKQITRRAALAAIPACGVAPILPAMAEPSDAELFRLMDEWRRQYDLISRPDRPSYTDVAEDHEFQRLVAIERQIAGIRPTTIEGFAAKLLVLTSYGEFDLDGTAECILPDALAISGFAPPSSLANYLDRGART